LDVVILTLWSFAALLLLLIPGAGLMNGWFEAVMILVYSFSWWAYFALFECLRNGQTPGKRRFGIRVVQTTGHAVTFGAAIVRNLLRILDAFPPTLLLDAILIAVLPQARRLGDLAAGTMVVRDRPLETEGLGDMADDPLDALEAGTPELDEAEFRLLREFMERNPDLVPEVRLRLAGRLVERFAGRVPAMESDPVAALATLYRLERTRRRGRFAPAARSGGAAERFAVRKMDRWKAFRAMADRAARDGLDGFRPDELPEFASRYREVAADLARARTYRAPAGITAQLERLVAAGHNALYRDKRTTAGRIWHVVMRECPAAVLHARVYLLIATLAFAGPLAAGMVLMRERPELAQQVLPAGMLRRAEAGAQRKAAGLGYYEAGAGEQPVMASSIIGNNIRVAFLCLAGGALAGVGAVALLAFNGLAIGATFGHFANLGLGGYLGAFVVGHGTLELFAICVAGAAGLLLGMGMIAPGRLARGEALVVRGRVAVRMIGAVAVMLLIAGLIEGFVSAGTGSVTYRVSISLASLVFLLLYLGNGGAALRRGDSGPSLRGAEGPKQSPDSEPSSDGF
ncbi:MAG: stage II sporulation protein M, partial [Gemmatimonadales bacterium]